MRITVKYIVNPLKRILTESEKSVQGMIKVQRCTETVRDGKIKWKRGLQCIEMEGLTIGSTHYEQECI